MKNDLGNKTRRRKVALSNLEKRVPMYSKHAEQAEDNGEKDQINPKRIAESRLKKTQTEIEILKKRVGTYHD